MKKYINGSDILLAIKDKALGSAQEHTTTYDSTTKERAVKAPETEGIDASLFTETSVTGLSITISFKGLQASDETELTFDELLNMWKEAKPIDACCFRRPKDGVKDGARAPYLKAKFVITKLSESAQSEEDASYDGELKMTGAPEIWAPVVPSAL